MGSIVCLLNMPRPPSEHHRLDRAAFVGCWALGSRLLSSSSASGHRLSRPGATGRTVRR